MACLSTRYPAARGIVRREGSGAGTVFFIDPLRCLQADPE